MAAKQFGKTISAIHLMVWKESSGVTCMPANWRIYLSRNLRDKLRKNYRAAYRTHAPDSVTGCDRNVFELISEIKLTSEMLQV